MTLSIDQPRLLIVDDDPINIKTLLTILGAEYKYSIATNGMDALKTVATKPTHLILLDIVMPEMDGFEVYEKLKADDTTRDIPVIFVTSNHSSDEEVRGLTIGAVDFLTKPLDPSVVLARVKTHLRLSAQTRLLEMEIQERKRAEDGLLQIQQFRTTSHLLLRTVLEPLSITQQMEKALDIILDIPWLAIQRRGSIFLVDEKSGDLVMVAHRNLPDDQLVTIPGFASDRQMGAAKSRKIIFIAYNDEQGFQGVQPHGIYCVTIFQGEKILGMLNLYVEVGYVQNSMADELLSEISQTLGRIIDSRKMDEALETAKRIAEDASRTKSRFLANMSHEIRTPLNGIIGYTQLLARGELSVKQHQYLEMIQQSGKHLLTVISDILDFSKIEANKVTLEEIPFALHDLLEKTANLVALIAKEKGVALTIACPAEVPEMLLGDPNRIKQILYNLLSNAVKFTEQGRIDLWVALAGEEEESALLRLGVNDTGLGIAPEQLEKLFKPFGQADDSTTRKYGGTGLGLVISSELARLMGGKMEVTSVLGHGSQFCFTASFKKLAAGQDRRVYRSSDETLLPYVAANWVEQPLLVVEDDEVNRLFMTELLGMLGFTTVDIANNGLEALERLAENKYALVLMDCQMPEMDGYVATGEIRRRESGGLEHLPVIALTANAMGGDREKCLAAGMDDFLTKPLEVEELKRTLARWLGGKPESAAPLFPKIVPEDQNLAPLDRQGIAELWELFGEAKLTKLFTMFLQSLPEKMTGIREAVEKQDPEQLHSKTHTLKGNCGMIKAFPMLDACQKLVDLGRSGTTQGAEMLYERLEEECKRLVDAIKQEMDRSK